MFSSVLYWSTALRKLATQDDKAIYTTKFINRECNSSPVQLLYDLFDKLVLPKLLHGCEILGYTVQDEIEICRKF